MKILGVVGSPRKGGNTDVIVGQVLAGAASKGAEVERLYLDDLQIRPCRACFNCAETGKCAVEDDFQTVLRKWECIFRLGRIYEAVGDEEKMCTAFKRVLALDIGDEEIEGYARQALGR